MFGMTVDADGADAAAQQITHEIEAGLEDAGHNYRRPVALGTKRCHDGDRAPKKTRGKIACLGQIVTFEVCTIGRSGWEKDRSETLIGTAWGAMFTGVLR